MKLALLKGFYDENITIEISSSPCAIGRSTSADFIIAHVNVSRNHCEIVKENTCWKISDNSSSGTYINDLLVGKGKSTFLNDRDVIRFGPLESKLCWTFHSFDSCLSERATSSDSDVKLQEQLVLDKQTKVFVTDKNCFDNTVNLHSSFEKNNLNKGRYNSYETPENKIVSKNELNTFSISAGNALLEGKIPFAKKEGYNVKSKSENTQDLKKDTRVQNAPNEVEEKNCALSVESAGGSKSDFLESLTDLMETEFQCTICSELFLMAVTLSCTHTFCKFCIDQWKKKQRTCPICRKKITNETRSLVVDNYIDKVIGNLSLELKERREAILRERNETEPSRKRSKTKTKSCKH